MTAEVEVVIKLHGGPFDLSAGASKTFTVKGTYSGATTGVDVTNTVAVSGELNDGTSVSKNASYTHRFYPLTPGINGIVKSNRAGSSAVDEYALDQITEFTIGSITNTGNTDLDKIELIDTLPNDVLLIDKIETGVFSDAVDVTVSYEKSDDLGVYHLWDNTIKSDTKKNTKRNRPFLRNGKNYKNKMGICTECRRISS